MSEQGALDLVEQIRGRLAVIEQRIRAAGDHSVRIVGVTKRVDPAVIDAARAAGLAEFAESYAQELLAKFDGTHPGDRLHFIGHLQTNKVRFLAGLVTVVDSVDRVSLIDELGRRLPGVRALIQVNTTGEGSKSGCSLDEVPGLLRRAADAGVAVDGLMTIGPTNGDRVTTIASFRTLRSLADEHGLAECSMGMSADLEDAVACGSTQVRIGTALFGVRPPATVVG